MTLKKRPVSAKSVLNEAYDYENPVPFSRAYRVDANGVTHLYISGTAAVNERGESVAPGNLAAQAARMFENVSELLTGQGASWNDVVRTTFYFRDIDRDYGPMSRLRSEFFKSVGLTAFPASTGIEARLCRPELLIEMEALAIYETPPDTA
ncbi:RidA family protein [bacterium]|nr:RidA family protein [bacterium]